MIQIAPKSACPVADIALPKQYRRVKISQDKVDYINGGGIKSSSTREQFSSKPKSRSHRTTAWFANRLQNKKKQEAFLHILLSIE